ncbi:CPBP family intramembrane metalloprotease [Cronobacter sakazakii]|nr:CPBP family intramembrane metalloprotease [Cronobacter sakazakii]
MAAVKIAATIIIFPLLEELVFRGIILSSFLNALGEKAGYIIGGLTVSVLFAVIHTVFIAHQNPNVFTFINFLWSKISKQRASFTNSTACFLYRAWPIY